MLLTTQKSEITIMKKITLLSALALATAPLAAQTNENGGHRGLDFGINTGYSFFTGSGNSGGEVPVELSLGKRFNKNFYWGISSGVLIPTSEDAKVQVPVTTDFKVLFPLNSPTVTPGVLLRAGYVINTAEDKKIKIGKKTQTIESPDHIMIQAMPTVDIALSKKVDFILGLGYTHYVPTKGSGSYGAVMLKTAFNFHSSTAVGSGTSKPKVPTRDRGLGIEGNLGGKYGFTYPVSLMGDLALMYKWNPNISFGIGGGYEYIGCEGDNVDPSLSTGKIFARGEYRLNDNRISPFGSVDLGVNMYSVEDDYDEYTKIDKSAVYVSPAVGLSFHTTNNSYFKVKLGYNITSKVTYKEIYNDDVKIKDKLGVSGLFLNIGYAHTFSWGENWFK